MKKVLLTLTLAAFAFAANAQLVVGGQLGFNSNSGNTNREIVSGSTTTAWTIPTDHSTDFQILPKIGYQLNDNMQVGAALGITYQYNRVYDPAAYGTTTVVPTVKDRTAWTDDWTLGFQITPYFRYNVTQFGSFTFFCEAAIPVRINGKTNYHRYASAYTNNLNIQVKEVDTTYVGNTNSGSFGITITPGLNYKLNENISLDLYIDLLGLQYTHGWRNTFVDNSALTPGTTNTTETTVTTNNFRFIANANAQSLNSHFNLFRLGFNYHF